MIPLIPSTYGRIPRLWPRCEVKRNFDLIGVHIVILAAIIWFIIMTMSPFDGKDGQYIGPGHAQ